MRCGYGVAFLLLSFYQYAAITIKGSRIILKHSEKETILPIKNSSAYPVIIQSWVDDGHPDGTPEKAVNSPVISIPVIFRLNEGELKYIRLLNKLIPYYTDHESLYWLNLYEIAPKPKNKKFNENAVSVATRLQIKLFYRPDKLNMTISEISDRLTFAQNKKSKVLIVCNPTPFYVTFSMLRVKNPRSDLPGMMLKPFSLQDIKLMQNWVGSKIEYQLISDSGEHSRYEKVIDLNDKKICPVLGKT